MAKRRDTGPRSSAEIKIGALMLSKLMLCEDDELDDFRQRHAAQLQPHVLAQLRDVLDALHVCMSGSDAQKLQQLGEAWSAFGGESSTTALPEAAAQPAMADDPAAPARLGSAGSNAPPAAAAETESATPGPAPAPPAPAPAPPAPAPAPPTPAPAPPAPAPAPPAQAATPTPPPIMPGSGVTPAPVGRKSSDAASPWAKGASAPSPAPPAAAPPAPPAVPPPPAAAPPAPPAAAPPAPAVAPPAPAAASGPPPAPVAAPPRAAPTSHRAPPPPPSRRPPPPPRKPAASAPEPVAVQPIDDPRTHTSDDIADVPDALPYRSNAGAEPPPPVAAEVKADFNADPLNATAFVDESPLHKLDAAMPFKSSSEDSAVESVATPSTESPSSAATPPPSSSLPAHLSAMTLEQYAALSAECTTYPEWTEHVLTRYHVRDAAERTLLDQHWQARRDADPQLEEQYRWYFKKYEDWAKSQQRS